MSSKYNFNPSISRTGLVSSKFSTNGFIKEIGPKELSKDIIKIQKKTSASTDTSEAFFEIFWLKLYFDDILIICILFLLYTEKVQDENLFICLILLLLT